jgi:hypothetical protein
VDFTGIIAMTEEDQWLRRLEPWLSSKRLSLYRERTHGDEEKAEELYRWNTELAVLFYDPLQCLEVTLRNQMDQRILIKRLGTDWYLSDRWRGQRERNALDCVKERLNGEVGRRRLNDRLNDRLKLWFLHVLPTGFERNNVIAELPLGFWCNLISPFYERLLWQNQNLQLLFPFAGGSLTLREAQDEFNKVLTFRNNVAHYEPIFFNDLSSMYNLVKELTGWISLEMKTWVAKYNDERFRAVWIDARPSWYDSPQNTDA